MSKSRLPKRIFFRWFLYSMYYPSRYNTTTRIAKSFRMFFSNLHVLCTDMTIQNTDPLRAVRPRSSDRYYNGRWYTLPKSSRFFRPSHSKYTILNTPPESCINIYIQVFMYVIEVYWWFFRLLFYAPLCCNRGVKEILRPQNPPRNKHLSIARTAVLPTCVCVCARSWYTARFSYAEMTFIGINRRMFTTAADSFVVILGRGSQYFSEYFFVCFARVCARVKSFIYMYFFFNFQQ